MNSAAAKIRIRPAREGLIVLDPATRQPIPPEGLVVLPSSYWARRLSDGDVVLASAPDAVPHPEE